MQTGSLVNLLYSNVSGAPAPAVGMGATILAWTDRRAGTIIAVGPKGEISVQQDKATRTDKNGMSESQDWSFEPNPNGAVYVFKPVARGKAKGQLREGGRRDGQAVLIGRREEYYDFSF